jgi:hypothetical protein
MSVPLWYILHLSSLLLFVGVTFTALAAPQPERRRRTLMWSGVLAILVVLSGFALLGILRLGMPGWAIAKLACWLALAMVPGLAFRRPGQMAAWTAVTIAAVMIAVGMATLRPF